MDYERVHLVKPEVFVYRIPPLQTNRAARAADWKLDNPDWTGRCRLVSLNKQLFIKLEDKTTGELFAKAPVDKHPGIAVQSVSDSSRYFVVRLMDDGGRSAFIGLGFLDRGDSFDFNVALQDFFKDLDREAQAETEATSGFVRQQPNLDLAFKEGQTIRLNIGSRRNDDNGSPVAKPRPSPSSGIAPPGGAIPFLPPPPTGLVRVAATPKNPSRNSPANGDARLNDSPDFSNFSTAPHVPQSQNPGPPSSTTTTTNPFLDTTGGDGGCSFSAMQQQPSGNQVFGGDPKTNANIFANANTTPQNVQSFASNQPQYNAGATGDAVNVDNLLDF